MAQRYRSGRAPPRASHPHPAHRARHTARAHTRTLRRSWPWSCATHRMAACSDQPSDPTRARTRCSLATTSLHSECSRYALDPNHQLQTLNPNPNQSPCHAHPRPRHHRRPRPRHHRRPRPRPRPGGPPTQDPARGSRAWACPHTDDHRPESCSTTPSPPPSPSPHPFTCTIHPPPFTLDLGRRAHSHLDSNPRRCENCAFIVSM